MQRDKLRINVKNHQFEVEPTLGTAVQPPLQCPPHGFIHIDDTGAIRENQGRL